jgi:chromosome segregation ATPase
MSMAVWEEQNAKIAALEAELTELRSDIAKWVTDYQAQKMRNDRLEWERSNIDEGLRRLSESEIAFRNQVERLQAVVQHEKDVAEAYKAEADALRRDAERYRAFTEYMVSSRTDFDDVIIACNTSGELSIAIDLMKGGE